MSKYFHLDVNLIKYEQSQQFYKLFICTHKFVRLKILILSNLDFYELNNKRGFINRRLLCEN